MFKAPHWVAIGFTLLIGYFIGIYFPKFGQNTRAKLGV